MKPRHILNADEQLKEFDLASDWNKCLFRAKYMMDTYDLEVMGGTIYTQSNMGWQSLYPWHYWCVNDNDEVIDSWTALIQTAKNTHRCMSDGTPNARRAKVPTSFKYKMIDVSEVTPAKYLPQFNWSLGDTMGNDELRVKDPIAKWLEKYYDKNKYDFVYVSGLTYNYEGRLQSEDKMWEHFDAAPSWNSVRVQLGIEEFFQKLGKKVDVKLIPVTE